MSIAVATQQVTSEQCVPARTLPTVFEQAEREGIGEQAVLETLISGQPASVAVLVGEKKNIPLPVCLQLLSDDGRFDYLGGSVPYNGPLPRLAQETAVRAVTCMEGLQGYVGVDLILHEDGSGISVVEINPRLTTSYVGLRAAFERNLMAAVCPSGDPIAFSSEPIKTVRLTSDGKISQVTV